MTCPQTHDMCIVRGDAFETYVTFLTGWEEVIADPTNYTAVLSLREAQDDGLPILLRMESPISVIEEPGFGEVGLATFNATSIETQALPPYDIVGFCEIVWQDTDEPRRLFNTKVEVSD